MGAGASTLSADAQAAIKLLPEATQTELNSAGTLSAEALTKIKETLPAAVQAELEGLRSATPAAESAPAPASMVNAVVVTPSISERIAAPVFYPFRWEEAAESVSKCTGGDGTTLTLPKMIELSAALLELPNLRTIEITGGTFELLSNHKAIFEKEGYSDSFRELLRTEKQRRLAQLDSLDAKEKGAMADAVCGCCNDEHRPRVASTIGAILMGDVSSLVLDEALNVDVPPALEQLGKLAELRILDLTRNRLPVIPEYLGGLHSLQQLLLYDCGLVELPASLGKLRALQKLELGDNQLPRLPDSFAELKALRELGIFHNQMTILPQWVAQLPHLFILNADSNPWQFPPPSVIRSVSSDFGKDLSPLRRYYEAIAKHGASTSRRAKMVLVGTGKAGKSSTLRGMKYSVPRPFAEDERTVQLDIWTLALGEVPQGDGVDDDRVVLSAWDFAGQPEYAAGQQQYLIKGALYLLLVPAHRANDAEADEVLLRWLDALQAKAPGAAVQVVLSHTDRLEAVQSKLASLERRNDEYGDPEFETALEDLLDASPTALADAAAPQLAWLQGQLSAHTERAKAAAAARGGSAPVDLLRIQPTIPCVCAAEGGDASLLALRHHLHTILTTKPPLLPSIGFVLPNSWAAALALPAALREGLDLSTLYSTLHSPAATDSAAAAAAPAASTSPHPPPALDSPSASPPKTAKRPYILLADLQSIWTDEIAPRALPGEASPLSILTDALELLSNQGELFLAAGMVFLDPGFATELLRPLVDHTLTSAADAKADVEKYVSATPGLASDAGLVENLLREIDAFVAMGLLSPRLLPFFWRATALAPADHDAAKRMLLDAGVLIEVAAGEEMRLMMPMRMSVLRPPAVADSWDAKPPENQKGEARQGVRFDLTGARLPPGVIERCVGSATALVGWRPIECWRHGVLLREAVAEEDDKAAAAATALLEMTSSELTVEVRGGRAESSASEALQQALAPLVGVVDHVLSEYPGFVVERKQLQ